MSQLIKVTTTPYEAVHIRQNARLISHDSLDSERRKIMARRFAMQMRYAGQGAAVSSGDMGDVQRIFAKKQSFQTADSSVTSQPQAQTVSTENPVPQPQPSATATATASVSSDTTESYVEPVVFDDASYATQAQASFDMERASFELRVAQGNLTYVPSFDMTIVLSRPEVHFEYLGDFNYVPPSWSPAGENVNLVL